MVLKKKIFEYILMSFYISNSGHPGVGLFWTLGPSFEQLVKDHKAMLHTEFQASEPSSSEEEDF